MLKRKWPVKWLFFLFVSLVGLSVLRDSPTTNAFLKQSDTKVPVTSIGDLQVKLTDTSPISNLALGTSTPRPVTITNKGDLSQFVRLLIHPVLESATGIQQKVAVSDVIQGVSPDWVNGEDGYYYYRKKLGKGETTPPVLTHVTTSSTMTATDTLVVQLKVEVITTKGGSYRQAWWEGQLPSATYRPALQSLDATLWGLKD